MEPLKAWILGGSSEVSHGLHKGPVNEEGVHDVVIAGAGPAGATCAYYLKRANPSLRVALLDKARFPRDKFCGDAWCAPALTLLEEMGVLQQLEAEGLVCDCLCGGFISPAGHSFIANDRDTPTAEKNMTTRCYAIKRRICDERIVRAAVGLGAELLEGALVESTVLDERAGLWTVRCGDGRLLRCRLLVAADGAASHIARRLGVVQTAPTGVASRQYVEPGTHNFKADGVLLYPEYTLPGYVALFRHFDDSIDLGCYLLPGGTAKHEDIAQLYERHIRTDPFVSRALGPNAVFAERPKVGALRLGGEARSYGEHLLVVGDAAGQTDPLTGEGIHTGMAGGKLAAETAVEMFAAGDFSARSTAVYHRRWMAAFGLDFKLSALAGPLVRRCPWLMDAVPLASAGVGGKAGSELFAAFGAVMTGALPKSTFLRPTIAVPLGLAVGRQLLGGGGRAYADAASSAHVEQQLGVATSWEAQCLADPSVEVGRAAPAFDAAVDDALEAMFAHTAVGAAAGSSDRRFVAPVLVLYGTEYGHAREVAEELCTRLARGCDAGVTLSPRCVSLSHFELVRWEREALVVVACSTAGDGDPPVSCRAFFEWMRGQRDGEHSAFVSKDTTFAVLALGDSAYPHFCAAGREVAACLRASGAVPLVGEDGEDLSLAEMDGEDEETATCWFDNVQPALLAKAKENAPGNTAHLDSDGHSFALHEDYLCSAARTESVVARQVVAPSRSQELHDMRSLRHLSDWLA